MAKTEPCPRCGAKLVKQYDVPYCLNCGEMTSRQLLQQIYYARGEIKRNDWQGRYILPLGNRRGYR